MTRSQINQSILEAKTFFKKHHYPLPDFAFWTPEDWQKHLTDSREIINTRLGWDITDFGRGNFNEVGRVIFTLRNGLLNSPDYPKSYAQKIMHLLESQKSPIHYHLSKREDIINISGGKIAISLWSRAPDNSPSKLDVVVSLDGSQITLPAGKVLLLKPGQSVCVTPGTFHEFYAQSGSGDVLSMEVSSTCDDLKDNIWQEKADRFPPITEDVPPKYFLCSDYAKFL